jgi:PhzF family phenazine biosynthesis protein
MAEKVVEITVVSAFTTEHENSGNKAGIIFQEKLSAREMQNAAHQLGFSETVFITCNEKNQLQFRYFTPVCEVPLCGHATIATAAFLAKKPEIHFPLEAITNAGKIKIYREQEIFFMEQPLPIFGKIIESSLLTESLNTESEILRYSSLQPQIVSTGLPDLIIPVSTEHHLDEIEPNFPKISQFSETEKIVGYHLFAISKDKNITASCRNFAPLYGINEESATGTASGALACYLFQNGIKSDKYIFEQGKKMGKPSQIFVRIRSAHQRVTSVLVGGKAKIAETNKIIIHT